MAGAITAEARGHHLPAQSALIGPGFACALVGMAVVACLVFGWLLGRPGRSLTSVVIETMWRGDFTNEEANRLHAEAFETRVFDETEWNWEHLVPEHSLGWATARSTTELVGFVNVLWDGLVHAWIQDVMVAAAARHHGVGKELVRVAAQGARDAGCEWLHVDFEDHLRPFYFQACGFTPTNAGLLQL